MITICLLHDIYVGISPKVVKASNYSCRFLTKIVCSGYISLQKNPLQKEQALVDGGWALKAGWPVSRCAHFNFDVVNNRTNKTKQGRLAGHLSSLRKIRYLCNYTTPPCLGHLGWCNTNRIISICMVHDIYVGISPKVVKAIKDSFRYLTKVLCSWYISLQEIHFNKSKR